MKSKFANLNLGTINVLSAEQKKGVTGGAYGSGGCAKRCLLGESSGVAMGYYCC